MGNLCYKLYTKRGSKCYNCNIADTDQENDKETYDDEHRNGIEK